MVIWIGRWRHAGSHDGSLPQELQKFRDLVEPKHDSVFCGEDDRPHRLGGACRGIEVLYDYVVTNLCFN